MLIWSVAIEACVNGVQVNVFALMDMKALPANEQAVQDFPSYVVVMECVRQSNSLPRRTMVTLMNFGIRVARWDVTVMLDSMVLIVPR